MNKFTAPELCKLLRVPLGKRIDQKLTEKWSASFWALTDQKPALGDTFVMMFPPPNITGNLHLGHALTAAVQDALVRHRKMKGQQVIWIPGFDHAGLATQNIVEKQLWHKRNITRQQLGREEFIKLADEWKDHKRNEMRDQLDRLGLMLNHDREYFTMDDNSSVAVQAAFKKLFRKGVIYRSTKPVFWSEQMQTTLSDIEVEQVDGTCRYTRTGEVVEKRSISQWFINSRDMAHRSVEAVESASIEMIPPNYKRSWSSWLLDNGVEDWCISRQSWWGHRIPAYKLESADDEQQNWVVADSLDEARELLATTGGVVQDEDVLDTWFSSSLLPLTISGWPDTEKFSDHIEEGSFPLDIMETGFDILTYWVSKMVMISIALEDRIPFKLILLHGMICDSSGKKMSKSKGNVIDPLDVIDGTSLERLQQRTRELHSQGLLEDAHLEQVLKNQKKLFPSGIPECGSDGLRAYLLSHDIQEEVVRIQIMQIEKVRRLSNKIWNIFRFVLPILENSSEKFDIHSDFVLDKENHIDLDPVDSQILHELSKCVEISQNSFEETYQLHHCFQALEYFWAIHLSSTYLRSVKSIITDDEESSSRNLKLRILVECLVKSTKLLHPFMPHTTEFLYQKLNSTIRREELDLDNFKKLQALSYEPFPSIKAKIRG